MQPGLHVGRDPLDLLSQLTAVLEVRALVPALLRELGDRSDNGLRRSSRVVVGSYPRSLEQFEAPETNVWYVALQQRDEHRVAAAEVVMQRGRVALTGATHDFGERHVVDAAFGEQARRGVEQLVAGVRRFAHRGRA